MVTTKIDVSKSTITGSVIDELMSKGEVQLFSSEPLTEQEILDEEQLSILNAQVPPDEFFKYNKYIGKGLRSQIQEYEWDNLRSIEAWKKRAEDNLMYRYVMGSDPVRADEAADTQLYNWQLRGREGQRISPVETAYSQQWRGLTTENYLYNAISNNGSRIIDVNASFDLNPELEIPNGLLQTRRSSSRRKSLTQRFKEDAEKLYNAVFAIENDKNLQSE